MINVVIVDDDNLVRMGLRNSLPWAKYEMKVTGAFSNGEQTLEFLRSQHVDLILLDLEMSGMTGLELLRRIRTVYFEIACVILTMHQDFNYVQEALREGALDYVLKVELEPGNFDEVLGRIKRRMNNKFYDQEENQNTSYELDENGECSAEILGCIRKAIHILRSETDIHLSAANVAHLVNMSRSYFSLCFKKATGKSFNDYYRSVKIEQAKRMLLDSRSSVKYIAAACGFTDERYFSTIFRNYTGMLPRDFRKNGR